MTPKTTKHFIDVVLGCIEECWIKVADVKVVNCSLIDCTGRQRQVGGPN